MFERRFSVSGRACINTTLLAIATALKCVCAHLAHEFETEPEVEAFATDILQVRCCIVLTLNAALGI